MACTSAAPTARLRARCSATSERNRLRQSRRPRPRVCRRPTAGTGGVRSRTGPPAAEAEAWRHARRPRRPGLQPGQVPRADGVVDADEVADAKRGKSGGRANGVEEPAACVDSLGERGEVIVVLACGDGTQQGRLASDNGQAPMPRGSLPHDPEHGQPAGPIGDAGPSPSSPGPIDLGSRRDGEAFRADRVRDLPYHRGGVVVRRGRSAPRTSTGSRTTSWSASHRAQKILVILHGVTARASARTGSPPTRTRRPRR